jgi:hypothetical protein
VSQRLVGDDLVLHRQLQESESMATIARLSDWSSDQRGRGGDASRSSAAPEDWGHLQGAALAGREPRRSGAA